MLLKVMMNRMNSVGKKSKAMRCFEIRGYLNVCVK